MKTLIVPNDAPYGTERSYNGLRLAHALAKRGGEDDAERLLQLERMLGSIISHGVEVGLCGTCIDARGVREDQLVEGARRSRLEELADWTLWADNVVAF